MRTLIDAELDQVSAAGVASASLSIVGVVGQGPNSALAAVSDLVVFAQDTGQHTAVVAGNFVAAGE